ncbi:hypothetical protein BX666DRAFT_1568493 [Dichotomocladium elegans]|nr:hypothetical protein BX666DRAFT_1568493 [Dichotomocladium elegans]
MRGLLKIRSFPFRAQPAQETNSDNSLQLFGNSFAVYHEGIHGSSMIFRGPVVACVLKNPVGASHERWFVQYSLAVHRCGKVQLPCICTTTINHEGIHGSSMIFRGPVVACVLKNPVGASHERWFVQCHLAIHSMGKVQLPCICTTTINHEGIHGSSMFFRGPVVACVLKNPVGASHERWFVQCHLAIHSMGKVQLPCICLMTVYHEVIRGSSMVFRGPVVACVLHARLTPKGNNGFVKTDC